MRRSGVAPIARGGDHRPVDLLAHMTTFVRVVEAGSLSAAARDLRISVPVVSRQMRALEDHLGGPLTLRTTRHLAVTAAGRRYYEHCVHVLAEVEAADAVVRGERRIEGLLTVTAPVTLGHARVVPHVGALIEAHPGLRIDLRLEDRLVDLVAEGVDVAVRAGNALPDTSSLVARPLFSFARVVVASPAYLERRGEPASVEAVATHDAIVHLGASGGPGAWELVRGKQRATVHPRGVLRTNNVYAIRDAAIAGLGLALLPDWLVAEDVRSGALRRVLDAHQSAPVDVLAVFRAETRGMPRIRVFVDHLARAAAR